MFKGHFMKKLINKIELLASQFPTDIINLVARFAIASVFWRSAQTKITGGEFVGQKWQFYNVTDSTFMLFEYEYALPIIPYELAAYLATFGEFVLSLTIMLGVFTRLSAFGLLMMTMVIQFLVYPDAWPTHVVWLVPLLYLIKHGGGNLSFDRLIK